MVLATTYRHQHHHHEPSSPLLMFVKSSITTKICEEVMYMAVSMSTCFLTLYPLRYSDSDPAIYPPPLTPPVPPLPANDSSRGSDPLRDVHAEDGGTQAITTPSYIDKATEATPCPVTLTTPSPHRPSPPPYGRTSWWPWPCQWANGSALCPQRHAQYRKDPTTVLVRRVLAVSRLLLMLPMPFVWLLPLPLLPYLQHPCSDACWSQAHESLRLRLWLQWKQHGKKHHRYYHHKSSDVVLVAAPSRSTL